MLMCSSTCAARACASVLWFTRIDNLTFRTYLYYFRDIEASMTSCLVQFRHVANECVRAQMKLENGRGDAMFQALATRLVVHRDINTKSKVCDFKGVRALADLSRLRSSKAFIVVYHQYCGQAPKTAMIVKRRNGHSIVVYRRLRTAAKGKDLSFTLSRTFCRCLPLFVD